MDCSAKKKNQFDNPTKAEDMNVTIYQIFEDDIKGFTVSGASPLAGGMRLGDLQSRPQ